MPRRSNIREKGQSLMEFAMCALFLVPMLAGAFTVGMSLTKAIQVGVVCRDANVLAVRGIDLANPQNKQLVVRLAKGLGMGLASGAPDPAGKGVVIISKVLRVGVPECDSVTTVNGAGVVVPDPRTTMVGGVLVASNTCTNYGYYVFSNRIVIGNPSQLSSTIGNPASSPDTYGDISLNNYVLNDGNRASGFPANSYIAPAPPALPVGGGLLYLNYSAYTYVAEAAFDISDINVFSILSAPKIFSRNVS